MEIIWFLIVGLVAGWLAGVLVKGGGYGLLGSIVVATLGAVILIVILRLIKRA